MTREEAIRVLYAIKDELMERHFSYKEHPSMPITAIDMAIEALSNNITESPNGAIKPSNDVINRADAIKAFENKIVIDGNDDVCKFGAYIQGVMDKIKALPSADAVQGEWIWRTDIPIGDGRTSAGYICSNCGKDYWHGNVLDVCPNCGARMKGGDEE